VNGKSRGERVLGRALRVPSFLDRKGTRWMLQGLSPAPVIVLVHRGRKSGRVYKTPLEVMREDRERAELVVAPLSGNNSDWYRNVIAGGLVEIHVRGDEQKVEWRELGETERREALDAYRRKHPIYSRIILGTVARVNRLSGDLDQAMARELPMLGLRRVGS
jgi:deazaflavin-dependent oxidoreductase (nitroreductase family)